MSMAWETTIDDVMNVFTEDGEKITREKAEEVLNNLDHDRIEKAALYGDDMLEQVKYAKIEIQKQIVEKGII